MERSTVYCLVPDTLEPKLLGTLERFYRHSRGMSLNRSIVTLVERRGGERRAQGERRVGGTPVRPSFDRRRIRNRAGRRVAERRAMLIELKDRPSVPTKARRHAEQLCFAERLAASAQHEEDMETARLAVRLQAGDEGALHDLYLRYFDSVYTYLRIALGNTEAAEEATQDVFLRVPAEASRYEFGDIPFRAWLFGAVRTHALALLLAEQGIEIEDTELLDARRGGSHADLHVLEWLTDEDLMLFIERLPTVQRQVVMLRYMMELTSGEVATVLGSTPSEVRQQHAAALGFLHERLTALGRRPRFSGRESMVRHSSFSVVLRQRRLALLAR